MSDHTSLFNDAMERGTKKLIIRCIEARYSRMVLREDAPEWVSTRFTSPKGIYELLKDLELEAKEHFIALHLDGKNRILCSDRVSSGSLNQSIVHPREVFKTALLSSAAAIILVHNHPSGDPAPSGEDIQITKRLVEAGELIGIKVMDHIVIGQGSYFSFVEGGVI